ncbi:MAG: hypothetical protein MZW92_66220 [Comamonadaceae bacterium]|nr:hypothetical protein [Comamonadaceae bacterium]
MAEAFGTGLDAAGGRPQAIGWLRARGEGQRRVGVAEGRGHAAEPERARGLGACGQAGRGRHAIAARRGGDRAQPGAPRAAQPTRRPTAERLNLLGSAHKRLALIERRAGHAAAERKALRAALAAYRRAVRWAGASA